MSQFEILAVFLLEDHACPHGERAGWCRRPGDAPGRSSQPRLAELADIARPGKVQVLLPVLEVHGDELTVFLKVRNKTLLPGILQRIAAALAHQLTVQEPFALRVGRTVDSSGERVITIDPFSLRTDLSRDRGDVLAETRAGRVRVCRVDDIPGGTLQELALGGC